jgi:hypothetical protein
MLRLLLGLIVAIALLYGGLHLMGRQAQMSAAAGGKTQPREVQRTINEITKIEAGNRAAMDRVVRAAERER